MKQPCLVPIVFAFLSISTESKLVQHTFEIDYGTGYPDGVKSRILKINKQFPGPTIEATVGDILQVDVINKIKDKQNTTIHWHGIHQQGTPFQDGPSMVTQCPIRYGHTQRYRFKLEQWGTFWYHSHVRSQYSEGLWGLLIIHPQKPPAYQYDHELVIVLNDWHHTRASVNEDWYLSKENTFGLTPFPDSFLLNGRGLYACNNAWKRNLTCQQSHQRRHVFVIPTNKRIRLRLINTSSRSNFNFSIDSHSLSTIEVDGIDVHQPVPVDIAEIAPAQRYSFIVTTNQTQPGQYRYVIRAHASIGPRPDPETIQGKCPTCTIPAVTAILQYDKASNSTTQIKTRTEIYNFPEEILPISELPPGVRYLDESLLLPDDKITAPSVVDQTIILDANNNKIEKGFRFAFNETLFTLPEDMPLLHKIVNNISLPSTFPYVTLEPFTSVRIIINNFYAAHPFHMHGHHFWVVGKFPMRQDKDGNFLRYDEQLDKSKINLQAVKRDTVFVRSNHVVIIMFYADNPGVWNFHCHIDWHNLGGMAFILNEAPDLVRRKFRISPEMKLLCGE